MVTLFLIVSNPVYRESLAVTLTVLGFRVVGTAGLVENPLSTVREYSPDVLLLDLPACDGLPLVKALCYHRPGPAVVVLVRAAEEGEAFRFFREGASGLVLATESFRQLVQVIERVVESKRRNPAEVSRAPAHLCGRYKKARISAPAILLTDREREIVSLIDRGFSNKEIAANLGIQLSTVKNHVHHLLKKLKARRRSEAAAQVAGRRAAL